MRVQCNACGAIYDTVLADGLQYFHACPPLSQPDVVAKIAAGAIPPPSGKAFDAFRAQLLLAPPPAPSDADIQALFLLQTTTFERANKRDENIVAVTAGAKATIKRDGAGVTELPPPPPRVVVVA